MMWIMPLRLSVMFFFFPAGLVLYWLTNNIRRSAQQCLINKQLGVLGNSPNGYARHGCAADDDDCAPRPIVAVATRHRRGATCRHRARSGRDLAPLIAALCARRHRAAPHDLPFSRRGRRGRSTTASRSGSPRRITAPANDAPGYRRAAAGGASTAARALSPSQHSHRLRQTGQVHRAELSSNRPAQNCHSTRPASTGPPHHLGCARSRARSQSACSATKLPSSCAHAGRGDARRFPEKSASSRRARAGISPASPPRSTYTRPGARARCCRKGITRHRHQPNVGRAAAQRAGRCRAGDRHGHSRHDARQGQPDDQIGRAAASSTPPGCERGARRSSASASGALGRVETRHLYSSCVRPDAGRQASYDAEKRASRRACPDWKGPAGG